MLIPILLAATLLTCTTTAAAEVAVIAHPEVGTDQLDAHSLQALYLAKKRHWPDGGNVALTINQDTASHDAFLDTWIGKSPSSFTSFWKRLVFTGKGKLPDSFADDAAVIRYVATTPGAIGYVDAASLSAEVKRIAIE